MQLTQNKHSRSFLIAEISAFRKTVYLFPDARRPAGNREHFISAQKLDNFVSPANPTTFKFLIDNFARLFAAIPWLAVGLASASSKSEGVPVAL